jgi:hypothetical protein
MNREAPKTAFNGVEIIDYMLVRIEHSLQFLKENQNDMFKFIKKLSDFVSTYSELINELLSLLIPKITHNIYLIGEVSSGKSTLFGVMTLFLSLIIDIIIETKFGFLIPTTEDNNIDIHGRAIDLSKRLLKDFFASFNMDIDNGEENCRSSKVKKTTFTKNLHDLNIFDTTGHPDRDRADHEKIFSASIRGRLIIFTIEYKNIDNKSAYVRFITLMKTYLTNLKVLCIITQTPADITPEDFNAKSEILRNNILIISQSYGIADEKCFIKVMKYSIYDIMDNPERFLNNVIGIFINIVALQNVEYYDIYTKLCKDKTNKSKKSPELCKIFYDKIKDVNPLHSIIEVQNETKEANALCFETNTSMLNRIITKLSNLSVFGKNVVVNSIFSITNSNTEGESSNLIMDEFLKSSSEIRRKMLKRIDIIEPKILNATSNFLITFNEINFNTEDNVFYNTKFPVFCNISHEVIGYGYFYKSSTK